MDEREQIEGRLQEQAAKEADRHTTPAREIAARLVNWAGVDPGTALTRWGEEAET